MDDELSIRPLADRVAAALQPGGGWFVSNAGWVIGNDETLVVDTFVSERRTAQLVAAVRAAREEAGVSETALMVALTHAHGDHANGAYLF